MTLNSPCMKLRFKHILAATFLLAATSCKKDNYTAPQSMLTGKFHYKGEPIQVEYNQVPFEVYQYGFGKVGPITETIAPEGTYSHLLFDGDYKLVVRAGQGPFYWPQPGGKSDSIAITVKGNTVRDIEVEPYYMIRTPQFSYASGKVTAKFKIDKIITDTRAKDVETAAVFINKTQFVSPSDNVGRTDVAGSAVTDPNNVSLTVTVPAISPVQNYVFARIGVKAVGVEDWIFSPVQKISF